MRELNHGLGNPGRCRKGVDPVLEGYPKFIAIDEEAQHQIVHRCRFGKTNRATHQTLDPGAQIEGVSDLLIWYLVVASARNRITSMIASHDDYPSAPLSLLPRD